VGCAASVIACWFTPPLPLATQLKGHDPQFWSPLTFNGDGSIQPMSWIDAFTLDVV
jgi:hypothetical protein